MMKKMIGIVVCMLLIATVFVPSIPGVRTANEDNGSKQRDWEIETVDSAGDTGWCTSIALDSNNYPHISYGNSDNEALKYAKWNGATWEIETVDSPGFGWTSIALDSDDYPHIAYHNQDSEYQKYAKWNGAAWEIEIVDSVWSYFASIALDSDDYPHISYYEMNNEDLKYAKWNGAAWEIETVDSVGDVGEYCSLALDSSDYPHISYRDNDNTLKHAWWDGTLWHIEVVEVIPGSYGVRYSSIAIDSSDKPHIAYKDYENDDLKYAKNTTGTWETETVDSTGDTGWYLSIALDSSDYPHISFSDWPGYNYRLKYAKWSGDKGWEIEIVDTAVDAGKFTSIALDSYDCPHISYNDGNLDDLKYAKKAPPEDTTPPETTCELEGEMEGDVYISDVTVYLNATDDISGVNYTMYKLDHGEFEIYEEPFVVSDDGDHTVYFYSVDNAGNVEDTKNCTFTIEHPCNIEINISGLFGVKATITNTGEENITGLECSIKLEGGFILFGKSKTDTIPSLAPGESKPIRSLVFGFGKPTITVTAGCAEATASGILILFFVLGVK